MDYQNNEILNKFRGSLLGLAVGDTLDVPLEFQPPAHLNPSLT